MQKEYEYISPLGATLLLTLIAGLLLAPGAQAQVSPAFFDYVRSDLNWFTIETDHFLVHFHADDSGKGSNRTARVVADIAEDIFEPITELYDYEPDTKVSFILKDYEDYSNGAAYFFDNVIEIWAPALNTPYRGGHNWLRNVITHEFTHMVQVQKSMKGSRRVPFYYLQLLDYEDVRRPDVLYGFPNVIATYPIPILNNPAWLAEGTAQYQREWMLYDTWDTHRDMLLRTRILAGEELTLDEMGGFYSHTSLMREGVYNLGFAFSLYLADRFGENALMRITDELASWTNFNFESAAKDAFGVPGEDLYRDWTASLREAYRQNTEAIRTSEVHGRMVVQEGFNNFYPLFSPSGDRLAYLSNQGEDFSRTRIHILDLEHQTTQAIELPGTRNRSRYSFTCSFGHVLTRPSSGPFDWHPSGESIVYARIRDTKEGYLYSDLYSMQIKSRKETRLTTDMRARSPKFAPDGERLVYISELDGTSNLYLYDVNSKSVSRLTDYRDGTQVTEPTWHPSADWIYFGLSRDTGRDIFRIAAKGGLIESVIDGSSDERTPVFDNDGNLYYASDRTGIFNLYRWNLDSGISEQLTNEIGGAFMPDISAAGHLVYSRYNWNGYHIAAIDEPENLSEKGGSHRYSSPVFLSKSGSRVREADKRATPPSDDSSIQPYSASVFQGTDVVAEGQDLSPKPYDDVFTSFSFLPVLRLDQYVTRQRSRTEVRLKDRTRAETLWRNLKIGAYAASREILGGLSMFGGLLVAPGSTTPESVGDFFAPSNLLDLERDLFIQFDYSRGLGFLKGRWSPQFRLELSNIRRNVEKGLALDEFPCTACYPDTTLADLSYNLWEVNLSAISKINRSLLIEAGYRYSPYRVTTERFFSKELQTSIPASSAKYFIGHGPRLKLYFEAFHAYRDADVVPHGLRIEAGYELEKGKLLDRFALENGFLKPVYDKSSVHRFSFRSRFAYRFGSPGGSKGAHGLAVQLSMSSILGKEVDNFYDDYVGGLAGARGYPFYALGGNETLWAQFSYTFPLFPRIKKQILFTYIDKVYARIYTDAALAWSGSWPGLENARKDVGIEFRLGLGSYYLLPTAIFVSATYGIDEFEIALDEGFVTPNGSTSVSYGNEFQWHAGVLFGFDLF